MSKAGRPNKYETHVKPRLDEIKKWSKAGCTNKEIATALGVGVSNFCTYLNKYQELRESVDEGRITGIPEVKLALFKKAVGFEYEHKKTYIKKDDDGKTYQYTELTKQQSLPDINAIGMYLRNYDSNWRDTDSISNKFKEMELELRRTMLEMREW